MTATMVSLMPWRNRAICEDTEVFYRKSPVAAMAVCHQCPVELTCREYAIHHEEFGVWGGTSERWRDRYRKRFHIRLESPQSVAVRSEALMIRRREELEQALEAG